MITEQMLKGICDQVENSLENYVLEHKGKLFEDGKIIEGGMEEQIKNLYQTRVASLILSKGENIKSLTQIQQRYVNDRMRDTLELSKKQYES